jgi:short-subunit dehydrogenase
LSLSIADPPTTRVIFVTGASSGIGYATCLYFAKQGWYVAGTARSADKLDALQQEINGYAPAGAFLPITADVRDKVAMRAAVEQVLKTFGRLDVLVANAGVGHRGAVVDAEWGDLETLLRTNIDGVLHSIRATVPALRRNNGGQIVIVSSVVWNMTSPYAALYAASKAFVSSLARSLRFELKADNITVTDLRIGRVQTNFSANRLGQAGRSKSASFLPEMTPERVAAAICDAVQHRRHIVTLRWLDRLLILANRLFPNFIAQRASRQYKPDEKPA